ncbi:phosphoglucosamine mutase [Pseudodesulfovibrio piezophilus]|uniref:Phosphoglucosamine mutase n=1 Tax=Pseudodesulfovibrio piezophilus (strain DSM 21447 / JCM 15486 / C1TLV30) TaxID=1322246 RepID=M1WLL6_PSEP2|nr:phosphoglucosamine mutase [Pseudodesulfovibrio piezophilus]CCH48075.1 Phosphoglucosamine mutase [Pseudodesulfovibrio piezophilus C1TLV30]
MKQRLFGTDGLRGQGNIYPMTPEIALRLGLAAGQYFRNGLKHHRVVIGKDTRLSGYVFETALTSGLCANGMDVFLVGPMPTPAISFLTRSMRASLGVVISASHNPFMDNGIKFFDPNGFKLPDEVEDEISELVLDSKTNWDYPAPENIGRTKRINDAAGRYIVYLKNSFSDKLTLDGLKVVLDCAHGAAYNVAPKVLEELGAEVIQVGVEPNGLNINQKCGSLYPEVISSIVQDENAHLGIALDGDADRLIVCDEKGRILDGDQIMALSALELLEKGKLPKNMLVSTVMSNMALEIFMQENGGQLLRTAVGDRYVVEAMRREGAMLGGEQSGHLIFMEHSTTGDGLLAALQLLRIMCEKQKPLSELAGLLEPFPQVLKNVHVERKIPFGDAPQVQEAVQKVEQALTGKGRVLLRYSGTEAVCRVMVEGPDRDRVDLYANDIVDACEKYLK